MIITIGGPIGSGTTTVAKALAQRHGMTHIYAGNVFRQMAEERGLSLADFSKLAEGDESIDREIDRRQKEEGEKGNSIVEGRLSAVFLEKADLKIWLTASLDVRAGRVAGREEKDLDTAMDETREREASEKKRYMEIYNIDITDLSIYDVVLNTAPWDAEGVTEIIDKMITTKG